MNDTSSPELAEAVFAGGCFWCVEAVFERLRGVKDVVSGYAGGTAETANYEAVCSGTTDHAEAVKVVYDTSDMTFDALLEIFFATHDPTQLNRQGPDTGRQYRSAIFYADASQKEAAEAFIERLEQVGSMNRPIVTTLEPLEAFYPAEPYHQNFARSNPSHPYVCAMAWPKVQKLQERFADRVDAAR